MMESEGLWVRRFAGESPPLVALHGFTQTGAVYAELAGLLGKEVLAPDLPGHGRSSEVPVSFASAVNGVAEVLASLAGPLPLVGYSQGGRMALGVALERPELVSNLVLVSASAGIEDEVEREERNRADATLAEELREGGLSSFLDRWLGQTMFERLQRRDADWRAADLKARFENTADGLAAALVGMGQGSQPYFGRRLGELAMPVLLLAGRLDEKYVSIATAMSLALPYGTLHIIPDAGHPLIAEKPRVVANLMRGFLTGSG
jgi:2-succinyl-6-hydroxy-2,4-cyclohexadiene-1-carboxylate synthase